MRNEDDNSQWLIVEEFNKHCSGSCNIVMLYSCSLEPRGLDLGRKQVQLYKCFGHLYW